ncbi:hypothetical protein THAOC_07402, partial [Thalassiosira oceanica]
PNWAGSNWAGLGQNSSPLCWSQTGIHRSKVAAEEVPSIQEEGEACQLKTNPPRK